MKEKFIFEAVLFLLLSLHTCLHKGLLNEFHEGICDSDKLCTSPCMSALDLVQDKQRGYLRGIEDRSKRYVYFACTATKVEIVWRFLISTFKRTQPNGMDIDPDFIGSLAMAIKAFSLAFSGLQIVLLHDLPTSALARQRSFDQSTVRYESTLRCWNRNMRAAIAASLMLGLLSSPDTSSHAHLKKSTSQRRGEALK